MHSEWFIVVADFIELHLANGSGNFPQSLYGSLHDCLEVSLLAAFVQRTMKWLVIHTQKGIAHERICLQFLFSNITLFHLHINLFPYSVHYFTQFSRNVSCIIYSDKVETVFFSYLASSTLKGYYTRWNFCFTLNDF